MSISGYTFLSIVQAKDVETGEVKAEMDYPALLESVRASIAQNHAKELAAALDDATAAERLQTLILKYTAEQLAGHDFDREEMTRRIYEDMTGLGLLTKYLLDPTVEEINDMYDAYIKDLEIRDLHLKLITVFSTNELDDLPSIYRVSLETLFHLPGNHILP